MKKMISYAKSPYIWVIILLLVFLVVWTTDSKKELDIDIEKVDRRDITEEVSGTARVAADEELDLSFEVSGVIDEIFVEEGDKVSLGDPLARLDTDMRKSEVESAEANLRSVKAKMDEMEAGLTREDREALETKVQSALVSMENAKSALEDVKEREDRKVKNAKDSLLTTDITARLLSEERSSSYSYEPPVISGSYKGNKMGEYRITLYKSQADSGYSFRYETDLETGGNGRVSTITPQPLGDNGLYILFPPNFARGRDLEWSIEIPNTDSPRYPGLKQAYESAIESREIAIREAKRGVREAESAYESAVSDFNASVAGTRSEKLEAQRAAVEQAQIALRKAKTNLDKSTLRAPMSGTVHTEHLSLGETVSPGVPVFSFVTSEKPHLTVYIPEVDVANLSVGDTASVSLDAFREEDFKAEVTHISKTATEQEGVAAFKTRLDFKEPDKRIRVGMTADVDIVTSKKEDVIAIPARGLIRKGGQDQVRILSDGKMIYREVERGLRGSDGWVEIVSGLKAGERVITYADEKDLEDLTSR
ncbi:MAG: efflux RND transporter periplasmic adaptor subunit [Patescibacteria group bacterium]